MAWPFGGPEAEVAIVIARKYSRSEIITDSVAHSMTTKLYVSTINYDVESAWYSSVYKRDDGVQLRRRRNLKDIVRRTDR